MPAFAVVPLTLPAVLAWDESRTEMRLPSCALSASSFLRRAGTIWSSHDRGVAVLVTVAVVIAGVWVR